MVLASHQQSAVLDNALVVVIDVIHDHCIGLAIGALYLGRHESKSPYADDYLRRPRAAQAGYPLRPSPPLQGQTTEADVTPRRPTRGPFWGRATPYKGRPHVLLDMLVIMTPFQP